MRVYIPSYFGTTDPESRQRFHLQQLNELVANPNITSVTVLAMNYPHTFSYTHPKIQFIHTNKIRVAVARNILLNMFFNTDDEWCIIADNDSWLDSHLDFITEISNTKFDKRTATLMPLLPSLFSIDTVKNELTYLDDPNFISTVAFYRNLPKHGIEPVFYDTSFTINEDVDFGFRILERNLKNYYLPQVSIQSLGTTNSTLVANNDERMEKWRDLTPYFESRYNAVPFDDGPLKGICYARYS
jgi:hypothetical protein